MHGITRPRSVSSPRCEESGNPGGGLSDRRYDIKEYCVLPRHCRRPSPTAECHIELLVMCRGDKDWPKFVYIMDGGANVSINHATDGCVQSG